MQKLISKIAFSFVLMILPAITFAQFSFTNANSTVMPNSNYHSGCPVTVADWNSDGLDDLIILDQAHDVFVEKQNADGSYSTLHIGDFGGGSGWAWGMAAGDFDHNGYLDILGGNGSVKLFMCNASGAMGAAINLPLSSIFLQNVTLGDFDNDGWLDIYGCHDVGESKIWLNDGAGNFPAMTQFTGSISGNVLTVTSMTNGTIKLGFYLSGAGVISNCKIVSFGTGTGGVGTYILSNSSTVASTALSLNILNTNVSNTDDSGNYGTTWSDYDTDGDLDFYVSKCRQPVNQASDMRRHDILHINDGTYHFTGDYDDINQGDQDSLLIDFICPDFGAQSWTTNFGDFDNDGDFDLIRTSYTEISEMWQNDGTGHFTNITASSGFDIGTTFEIESQIEDFNNDGFQDIILTGTRDIMFKNNGNMTFTKYDNTIFPGVLGSFATGDLNHDGAIDVLGCYNSIYTSPGTTDDAIYLNNDHSNHWITFNLVGTVSNKGAVGANVVLYTALGKQIREARAGESYGTENTFNLHFGLGANTIVDSAIIRYPSGITNKLYNLSADQFITNVETGCNLESGNISYTGQPVLCAGNSLTLNAPNGFSSYLWSTGETTQSINVTTTGSYNVQLSNGICSVYPASVNVINSPDETPTISSIGELTFCKGETVTLNSTSANAYTWSNGATTQSIEAAVSGTYTVDIQGACQVWTSNSIVVNVIDIVEPIGTDDFISINTTATLAATGTDVHWFDLMSGGTELGTGNSFTTPVLTATTTYYAEDRQVNGGGTGTTGQFMHTGSSMFSSATTTNGSIIFDVDSVCILKTVKVYTDSAATRRIVLTDGGGAILDSMSVFLPADSTIITLNFNLPVGTGYSLTTDATVNTANFGYASPRLQRSSSGVSYPYTIPGFVTLTGSNQGNGYYYYFYDWNIEKPTFTCVSDRTPVIAHVSTGISTLDSNIGIDVFPNPSDGIFNVQTNFNYNSIEVLDLLGRKVLSNNSQINLLNLSGFSKGTYILQLTDVNNISVRRQLVIE